jgi:hypothetical protein
MASDLLREQMHKTKDAPLDGLLESERRRQNALQAMQDSMPVVVAYRYGSPIILLDGVYLSAFGRHESLNAAMDDADKWHSKD